MQVLFVEVLKLSALRIKQETRGPVSLPVSLHEYLLGGCMCYVGMCVCVVCCPIPRVRAVVFAFSA